MNRIEALRLLNELFCAFESMRDAPLVSIAKVVDSPDWELQIQWLVGTGEKIPLDEFALKHGVTMRETKNYTYFR